MLDRILREVQRLGHEHAQAPYRSLTQFVLRYVLDEQRLTSMLVGGKNARQVTEQMSALEAPELPEADFQALREHYRGFEQLLNPHDG
jgi:aryl-alcohol dehydrogenase-like predicted oxidoreductase